MQIVSVGIGVEHRDWIPICPLRRMRGNQHPDVPIFLRPFCRAFANRARRRSTHDRN